MSATIWVISMAYAVKLEVDQPSVGLHWLWILRGVVQADAEDAAHNRFVV